MSLLFPTLFLYFHLTGRLPPLLCLPSAQPVRLRRRSRSRDRGERRDPPRAAARGRRDTALRPGAGGARGSPGVPAGPAPPCSERRLQRVPGEVPACWTKQRHRKLLTCSEGHAEAARCRIISRYSSSLCDSSSGAQSISWSLAEMAFDEALLAEVRHG